MNIPSVLFIYFKNKDNKMNGDFMIDSILAFMRDRGLIAS